jgi:hypothetical protein
MSKSKTLETLKGLLFDVEKVPMAQVAPGFASLKGKDYAIIGHPNEGKIILNRVSNDYHLVKNSEILTPLVELLEKRFSQMQVRVINEENARFDVQLKPIKTNIRVVGELIPMFNFQNSYDNSSYANLSGGMYRLVCENGATVPVKDLSFSYRFKHNDSDLIDLKTWVDVNAKINDFIKNFPKIETTVRKLKKRIIPMEDLEKLMANLTTGTLFPKKAVASAILQATVEAEQLNENMNLWLAYNGLNYILNHDRDYKIVQHVRNTIDEKLMANALAMVE